jgi:hypothetical protein
MFDAAIAAAMAGNNLCNQQLTNSHSWDAAQNQQFDKAELIKAHKQWQQCEQQLQQYQNQWQQQQYLQPTSYIEPPLKFKHLEEIQGDATGQVTHIYITELEHDGQTFTISSAVSEERMLVGADGMIRSNHEKALRAVVAGRK